MKGNTTNIVLIRVLVKTCCSQKAKGIKYFPNLAEAQEYVLKSEIYPKRGRGTENAYTPETRIGKLCVRLKLNKIQKNPSYSNPRLTSNKLTTENIHSMVYTLKEPKSEDGAVAEKTP